jgi:hypothetical protein
MKLDTVQNAIKSSGVKEHIKFRGQISAKAFELVASNYSNPVKAFIRELSTNAYEAHQLNGNENKPFDVSLPTPKNLSFVIRDYGPGLSPEEIYDIYTVLFCSTKDQSDEFDGCFGIGSKSPFAYVKNAPFTVTSINGGKKYYYTAYLGAEGEPCLDLLHSIDTNEPTGLEVEVPIRSGDTYRIHQEAEAVYSWFDVRPNIIRKAYELTYFDKNEDVVMEGSDFTIYGNYSSNNHVWMGNVLYPIDYGILGYNKPFTGVIIKAKRGSVIPDLSREQLKYGGKTTAFLIEKLEDIEAFIGVEVSKKIESCKNYYEAVREGTKLIGGFPGLRMQALKYQGKPLKNSYITLTKGKCHSINYNGKISYSRNSDFSYNSKNLFVCTDTKTYKPRISAYIKSIVNKGNTLVLCDKSELKEVAEQIGIDESEFILTSSIAYTHPKRVSTTVGTGNKTRVLEWNHAKYSVLGAWNDSEEDLSKYDGYYIQYHANQCKYKSRNQKSDVVHHPAVMFDIFDIMGLKSDTKIIGIKSELLNKISKKPLISKNLFAEFEAWVYNNWKLFEEAASAKLTIHNTDNDFNKFVKCIRASNIKCPKNIEDTITKYERMCEVMIKYDASSKYTAFSGVLGISPSTSFNGKIDKVFTDETKKIMKRFSLFDSIGYIDDDNIKEVGYYISGKGF